MKKQKIILTRGLPASGKTSWSKEQVAKGNGKVKRVNKDDLREMVDSGIWSKTNEQMILNARDALVTLFISNKDVEAVIVDDTNFEEKHFNTMVEFAESFKRLNNRDITVEYKDFLDVSLDECLHRDSLRAKPVGEKVIKGMHQRYILPTLQDKYTNVKNGNAIICDIDGCAAHRTDRDWFEYEKVINDEADFAVRNIVNAFYEKGYKVFFVSGREGTTICKDLTQRWLHENGFKHDALLMRKEGDYRRDSIVKQEIYEQHIKDKYVVEFVLDDRDQVVSKWRELGLKCLQVAPGNF